MKLHVPPAHHLVMGMVVRYLDGRVQEAGFLGASGNILRLIATDGSGVSEFWLQDGVWLSDVNEPVEIEYVAPPGEDAANGWPPPAWWTWPQYAAGRAAVD